MICLKVGLKKDLRIERRTMKLATNVSLGEGMGTLIPLGSAPHEMTIKILDRFGLF